MRYDRESERRIIMLVSANPKRPNTTAHLAFSQMRDGMTLAEFFALEGQRPDLDIKPGWTRREISWCLRKGFVRLDG